MPHITTKYDLVEEIINLTGEFVDHESASIQSVLDCLVKMGFTSARYYDVSYDLAANDEILILSAKAGETSAEIGYKIEVGNSTLGKTGSTTKAAIDDASSSKLTREQKRWVQDLKLEGKKWVDLPICVGEGLLGMIACDWPSADGELEAADVTILTLISSRVAANLALLPTRALEQTRERFEGDQGAESDLNSRIQSAADEIGNAMAAAIVAVFEHSPETGELTKIHEYVHPDFQSRAREFSETYPEGSTALTRLAWDDGRSDSQYRHIVDFKSLAKAKPQFVHQASLDRHTTLLGEITSILYETVGDKERRYLIRLMNRADVPLLPFVGSQREVFETLCEELSEWVDQSVTRSRLKLLQATATGIVTRIDDFPTATSLVKQGLSKEGFHNFFVFTKSDGGSSVVFECCSGEVLLSWFRNHKTVQTDGSFYDDVLDEAEPFWQKVESRKEHKDSNHFLGYLSQKHIAGIAFFPFRAGRLRGAMGVVAANPPHSQGASKSLLARVSAQQKSMLATYSAILSSCLSARDSFTTAEGARRLVGHIGHEVNTPAAIVVQKSLQALVVAEKMIREDDVETRNKLIGIRQSLEKASVEMDRSMDIALLVSQENKGRLQMQFARQDVYRILADAKEALASEMVRRNQKGETEVFEIHLGSSCQRIGSLICDAFLIRQLFVNLLRNGMKYSLPRYPRQRQPMTVEVNAMNQLGMVIFQITNWGLGIHPDEFEQIFKPFVRGIVHDRMKAIRGMGLGLFISRRIAVGHRGHLFCHHSEFTLDDPRRRELWEGFETTFELRIPKALQEGVLEHVWE